jgi:HAMP domain-containing protein
MRSVAIGENAPSMCTLWQTILSRPELATGLGTVALAVTTLVLAATTWLTSTAQRRHDARQRCDERRWDRLTAAAQHLRMSILRATEMDYSKSWRSALNITSWGIKWEPFLEEISRAGAALSAVRDELGHEALERYYAAIEAIFNAKGLRVN